MAKVSLAGAHYPDTTAFFSGLGIIDVTGHLAQRGWAVEGRQLYMADHYRAAVDMIASWALSDSEHCNVVIDEWFPSQSAKQRLLELLYLAKPEFFKGSRLEKVEDWLNSHSLR